MAGWQQIVILGNVGRDPELKYLASGVPVCNFTVAVNQVSGSGENRSEKTVWFRVAAWRQLGETCAQYLAKGRQVLIIGTIESRAYLDQSGQAQSTLELTAREVKFVGSRADGEGQGDYQTYDASGGDAPSDAGDIPF